MQRSTFMRLTETERRQLIIIILEDFQYESMIRVDAMIRDVLDNSHFHVHNKTLEIQCGNGLTVHYVIEKLKERMANITFYKKETDGNIYSKNRQE